MIMEGATAAGGAAAVGFRSASHYWRDCRQARGRPSAADAVLEQEQFALVPAE
ncbi:hypothetical protein [Curtobacterium sp. 179-B 9B NHS]|uniref:hypothetical protein n=1 Tax=Curtobacterium sp. 179-B 9B NHS TaxID=3374293 RepID=UPI00387A49D4